MPHTKRVLIIDDETDLSTLLGDYFQRKNCDVTISNTLTAGKEFIDTIHPDILILDNNLPDGVGWSFAPFIANQFPSTFILMISAFHPVVPEMPLHARYIVMEKPISMADLDKQFSTL